MNMDLPRSARCAARMVATRRHVAFALAGVLAAGVAACGGGGSSKGHASTSAKPAGDLLRIAQVEGGIEEAFDPALLNDNRTIELAQNVWEGLLDVDERLEVVPNVAKSFTVSDDGLVYTFKLRDDVKFQNGDPVTAADYAYAFNRSLDPKTASDTSFFLLDIAGAEAVNAGKAKSASGIKVLAPDTLRITLAHRAGYFPSLISRWPAWVVDRKVVEADGKKWVVPGKSVGTGPYQLSGQVGNTEYEFKANPDYRGGAPSIGRVKWSAIADSTAALARYQSGELDAVLNLNSASVLKVQSDPTLKSQFHSRPLLRTVWLAFDNAKPPFNDKRVRLAFNQAIDKQTLVKIALSGQATPANGWLPPGLPGNVNAARKPYAFDAAAAKKLLADAGFPDGKGLPKLTIYFTSSLGQQQQVFEYVQAQLQQNLGIQVGLKLIPPTAFDDLLKNPKTRPAMWGYTFGWDYPDAQEGDQYELMTGAPYNYGGVSVKEFDRLVGEANAASDQAERTRLYEQGENALLDEAPFVTLYYPHTNWIVKPYVKGFGMGPLYMTPWAKTSLAK